jgi:hypothetical protein
MSFLNRKVKQVLSRDGYQWVGEGVKKEWRR